MEIYTKSLEDNKIIFKNTLDNSELSVIHYDDEYIFDTIFLNEQYDLNFINYIIQELKKSKDIIGIFSLYDSQVLEKLLENNGLRVLSYQYTIKYSKKTELEHYNISNILDQEAKDFYLKMINMYIKINHQYIYPNTESQEINENYFKNEGFIYKVYRKNGKIVGIVDFQIVNYNCTDESSLPSCFNHCNKLFVRGIFSEEKQTLENIIMNLLNTYQRDIIINITYTENELKSVVNKLNGSFDFCQYILVDKTSEI